MKSNEIHWDRVITAESFPFQVRDFKSVQTHISYVFITPVYVYKIKKPVNFGFLDFSTLEKRKHFCEKEVELNRRLAPEIYLGVVPISKEGDIYRFEGKGEPVEYAVKMKPLPIEGLMQDLLKKKQIKEAHLDLIIDKLVPFYKQARTGEGVDTYGSIDVISYNTEENFLQTKAFVGKAIAEYRYYYIINYTRKFLKENASLFIKRVEEGFIREGHGDLYSANICFEGLKKVYIFDCIEFNERFRCGDVCSDIAFLAMDLDFHEEEGLSQYFVEEYVKKSSDSELTKLLNFYKCYRACVRGKIGCFTFASPEVPEEVKKESLCSARKYFDLAYRYAGGVPKLIVFMGLSGTGKSFLASKLLEEIPALYLSSDIVRKELLGLSPDKHYYAEYEKGIYSPEHTEKTYKELVKRAREALQNGKDVIVDATFKNLWQRRLFAEMLKKVKAEPIWIWCSAPESLIKERMQKRMVEGTSSDALWEIYLKQKETAEIPTERECNPFLFLDTSQSCENLLSEIKNFL